MTKSVWLTKNSKEQKELFWEFVKAQGSAILQKKLPMSEWDTLSTLIHNLGIFPRNQDFQWTQISSKKAFLWRWKIFPVFTPKNSNLFLNFHFYNFCDESSHQVRWPLNTSTKNLVFNLKISNLFFSHFTQKLTFHWEWFYIVSSMST